MTILCAWGTFLSMSWWFVKETVNKRKICKTYFLCNLFLSTEFLPKLINKCCRMFCDDFPTSVNFWLRSDIISLLQSVFTMLYYYCTASYDYLYFQASWPMMQTRPLSCAAVTFWLAVVKSGWCAGAPWQIQLAAAPINSGGGGGEYCGAKSRLSVPIWPNDNICGLVGSQRTLPHMQQWAAGWRMSWSPSWKYDIKSEVQFRQSMSTVLDEQCCQISSCSDLKRHRSRLFWTASPQQEQNERCEIFSWSNKYECAIDQELAVDAA